MLRQDTRAVSSVTKEQISAEIRYQASIAPFRVLLKERKISIGDYRAINTILVEKYRPLFVEYITPD